MRVNPRTSRKPTVIHWKHVLIPDALHRELKLLAVEAELDLKDLVTLAIQEWLADRRDTSPTGARRRPIATRRPRNGRPN